MSTVRGLGLTDAPQLDRKTPTIYLTHWLPPHGENHMKDCIKFGIIGDHGYRSEDCQD